MSQFRDVVKILTTLLFMAFIILTGIISFHHKMNECTDHPWLSMFIFIAPSSAIQACMWILLIQSYQTKKYFNPAYVNSGIRLCYVILLLIPAADIVSVFLYTSIHRECNTIKQCTLMAIVTGIVSTVSFIWIWCTAERPRFMFHSMIFSESGMLLAK